MELLKRAYGRGGLRALELSADVGRTLRRPGDINRQASHFFVERYAESYAAELDRFVACIETGRRPDIGADDGRKAMILCEAALASAKSGRFEPIHF